MCFYTFLRAFCTQINHDPSFLLVLGAQSNPFQNLDKSAVLQEVSLALLVFSLSKFFFFLPLLREITRHKFFLLPQARTFNETPINPRKCIHILTKIMYVLNQVSEFDGKFYMTVQFNTPIMNWLRLKRNLKIFIISR